MRIVEKPQPPDLKTLEDLIDYCTSGLSASADQIDESSPGNSRNKAGWSARTL
jgi:hypothetical protein